MPPRIQQVLTAALAAACAWAWAGCAGRTAGHDRAEDRDASANTTDSGDLTWEPVTTHPRVGDASVTTVLAPDGVATLVWVAAGPSNPRLMGQVQRPGEPWGSPVQIPTRGWVNGVSAGIDRQGTVTVVWSTDESEHGRYGLWAAQQQPGNVWSDPVRFASGPNEDIGLIDWDLSVGPTGAAVFEWSDESFPGLHAAYRPAAMAAWSKPIAPPGATSTENLATSVDSKGAATLAYLSGDLTGGARSMLTLLGATPEHGWGDPVKLSQLVGRRPFDLDASRPGEVVAVWQDADHRIMGARVTGQKTARAVRLAAAEEHAASILVQAATDGTAQVVWNTGEWRGARQVLAVTWDGHPSGQTTNQPQVIGPADYCSPNWSTLALTGNEAGDTALAWQARPGGLAIAYRPPHATAWTTEDEVVPDGHGPNCQGEWLNLAVTDHAQLQVSWLDSGTTKLGVGSDVISRRAHPGDSSDSGHG